MTTVHLRPIGTKEKEGRLLPQFACQERDEASDLYRDMAIGRIDRLQLYRADMPIGEKMHQPALPEIIADDKVGQKDDTDSPQLSLIHI